MNTSHKNNIEVQEALRAIGIEVLSSQYCNGNRFKLRLCKDGVEAVSFSPARNGHDTGDWLKAAISEAKRSLLLRCPTIKFNEPAKRIEAYSKADRPESPEPPAAEPPAPVSAALDPAPASQPRRNKHKKFLGPKERAEVYALLKSGAATGPELAGTYGVSSSTIYNIAKEGERGERIDSTLSAMEPAAPEVPRPKDGSADGENWAGTYSPAEVAPPAEMADTHAARVKLFADADRISMLLAKLKEYGAAVGVRVDYTLNIGL